MKNILIGKTHYENLGINNEGNIEELNDQLQKKFGYYNIIDNEGNILIVFGSDGKPYNPEDVKNSYISDIYSPLMKNNNNVEFEGWTKNYEYDTFPVRKENISDIQEVSSDELISLMLK